MIALCFCLAHTIQSLYSRLLCTIDCKCTTTIEYCMHYTDILRGLTAPDKWNFNPENAADIEHMHERVARRFHETIVTNQGLWIKAGQALGLQAALLPKPYRTAFSDIFDDAPTVPYAEIENVIKQDLGGKLPEEIFTTFEHKAVNSASIAQVHRATVRRAEIGPDGKPTGKTWMEDVAVKVGLKMAT